jgi:hypothetical protein
MGQHYWNLSEDTKVNGFYWFWVSIWIYYAGLFCVKISILLQYLRVFVQKHFQIACYVLIGVVTACSLWAIFSGIFMCAPTRHFWDARVPGKCMNKLAVNYSAAGVNAATDFATAILPLPLVGTLPISRQQKILLMIVFGFGFWLVASNTLFQELATNSNKHMHCLRPSLGLALPDLSHQRRDIREPSISTMEQCRVERWYSMLLRANSPQLHDQAFPQSLLTNRLQPWHSA